MSADSELVPKLCLGTHLDAKLCFADFGLDRLTGTSSKAKVQLMDKRSFLRLPVVSLGAEYLVMGCLMRRNILTYKAPPGNEAYDLICIHPDPRHKPAKREKAQIRVQVKSRYATDCDRGFPIHEKSLDGFDFLVIAFLNIGRFFGGHNGLTDAGSPEFYTLPVKFVREHHNKLSSWQKVRLRGLAEELKPYEGETGFEQIAEALGIARPQRERR